MSILSEKINTLAKMEQKKESANYKIFFRDHLDIDRKLDATSDKDTSKYRTEKIVAIVNKKIMGQNLTPELMQFVLSLPAKTRDKLQEWDILDANTCATFKPLIVGEEKSIKHSRKNIFDVEGGILPIGGKV